MVRSRTRPKKRYLKGGKRKRVSPCSVEKKDPSFEGMTRRKDTGVMKKKGFYVGEGKEVLVEKENGIKP